MRGKMEEVTALLKQARESRGVSLREVETATRVPLRYLEVLEGGGGNVRFLADRLYLVPFLRTYATFLNLDPNTAVTQFITELQKTEARAVSSGRLHKPSRFSTRTVLLSLLITSIIILSFVWYSGGIGFLWQKTEQEPSSSSSSELPPSQEPSEEPATSSPSTPSLSSEPSTELGTGLPPSPETSVKSSAPSSPPPSSSAEAGARETIPAPIEASPTVSDTPKPEQPSTEVPHLLRIRARERAWVRVTIDGEQTKDILLQPGERVEWSAQEEFILTLGNAGGVDLTFDGKDLPSLGASGQVIRNFQLPSAEE